MRRSFRPLSVPFAVLALGALACAETIATEPAGPVSLAIVSGQGVTTTAGGFVSPVPTVRVTDAAGAPVAGAEVLFAVTKGQGTITPSRVTTDADGLAALSLWRYNNAAGPQQLTASVVSSTSDARVVFNGTAIAGPATAIAVVPSTLNLQIGQTRQLVVNAIDQYGNAAGSSLAATFSSDDTTIAKVSSTGLVTAVAYGATAIVASYQGLTVRAVIGVGTRPSGTTVTGTTFESRPYGVAISPAGITYVTRVDAADFARINLPSTTIASTHGLSAPSYDLDFLPDGSRAYFANASANIVSVVNTSTNAVLRTISGLGEPYRVRAAPGGAHVYVTTSGGKLHRVTVGSDAVSSLNLAGALNGLAIDRSGTRLYATNYDGDLYEVSLASFTVTRQLRLGGLPQGISLSADGDHIYVANETIGLQVVSTASLTVTGTAPLSGAFDALVTLDGIEVYVTRPGAGTVTVVRASDLSTIRSINGGAPRRMALSADGTTIVITNESGSITIVK